MDEAYSVSENRTSLDFRAAGAAGWWLYPIWPVNGEGVCACPVGEGCGSPGKHPVGPAAPKGIKSASSDPREIAAMISRAPRGANVGLATGRESGVVVLDWDEVGCGGGHRRLQAQHGRLPSTRTHRTGSGNMQELYAYPPHLEHLPSRTIAPAVELKADGAGVVLPPSVTNWGVYEVVDDRSLAPLPDWIVDLATHLTVIEGGTERPTQSRYRLPERIREGERALTLYRYGCSLRAHGWTHAAILEELRRVNAERCDRTPAATHELGDAEVRKITRSATRHAPGSASPVVSPEVLEALESIEAAMWAATWPGMGGGSERDVMVTLVTVGRRHGQLIPAGVRISLDLRSLALAAGMGKSSAHRGVQRLRKKGWLRYDNEGRRLADSGALVLVSPGPAHPLRKPGHSTTPPRPSEELSSSRATKSTSVPPCAPRLRWSGTLGKRCGAILDALERKGAEMTVEELAVVLDMKRPSDVRRRYVPRLVEAGVVGYDEAADSVGLRPDWLDALDRERTLSGEKKAENRDRAQHERERDAFWQHLAHWEKKQHEGKER